MLHERGGGFSSETDFFSYLREVEGGSSSIPFDISLCLSV
jgi:hypothetical protein